MSSLGSNDGFSLLFTLQALLVCSSQAFMNMVQLGALHELLRLPCGPVSTAPS